MDIIMLNTSFEPVKIIDSFTSFIWTDRYSEYGDFELYLPPTEDNLTYMDFSTGKKKSIEDCYLTIKDSDHIMIIEDLQIDLDVENGTNLYISGRSLESILDRRIIWSQTVIKGNLQEAIKKLLDENIISPSDYRRKIDNFIFEESTDEAIKSLELTGEAQFTGDNLYSVISALCSIFGIGFKITLSNDNKLVFKLYSGVDRSYSQTKNPYVVFSPEFDNLLNSSYLKSKKNLKTITLIAGEGEGAERKTNTYEPTKYAEAGGYNIYNIRRITGASPRVDNDNSGIQDKFGTITNGVMHLKYGLVNRSIVWNGATIPIKQGGNYYVSCDVLVEESASKTLIYCALANMTKNTYVQPYAQSSDITKGEWIRYAFPAQTVPNDWVGDTVLLCLNAVGTVEQGSNIPIYAKNIMVTYENNTDVYEEYIDPGAGLCRRELYTDARDVSSTVRDENGNSKTLDDTEYNDQLVTRGKEQLDQYSEIQAFEGEAEPNTTFIYGTDYVIGDIVQIMNEYGIESRSRITEVMRSESGSGFEIYPTFTSIK